MIPCLDGHNGEFYMILYTCIKTCDIRTAVGILYTMQ